MYPEIKIELKKKSDELLEALSNQEIIIDAVETEDAIGTILRFHLYFETMLSLYLSEMMSDEEAAYIGDLRDYAAKMRFAVAYKLPLCLAAVFRQANNIRNKVAHNHGQALGKGDVQQFARLVNALVELNHEFKPVEKCWIAVPKKGPEHKALYGDDLRYDFIMCCMSFYTEALRHFFLTFAKARGVTLATK
jgi:hypothetical protein